MWMSSAVAVKHLEQNLERGLTESGVFIGGAAACDVVTAMVIFIQAQAARKSGSAVVGGGA